MATRKKKNNIGAFGHPIYGKGFAKYGEMRTNGSSEIPNNLEEAAEEYRKGVCEHPMYYAYTKQCFIAGAKWQKEQMMSEAAEGSITSANGALGYDIAAFLFDENHRYTILLPHKEGRKHGDKVRIIIVKED